MRSFVTASLFLLPLPSAASAQAWDGVKPGKITTIEVTNKANFGFRVILDGSPMCGTASTFAYLNPAWDNYDVAVAMLSSAYMSGRPVILYTRNVSGNCEIGHLAFK